MRTFLIAALSMLTFSAAAGEPRFQPARVDDKGRFVRFEPFAEVDWRALAKRHFRLFDIDRLSPKDIVYVRERRWEISGETDLTYRAPLTKAARAGTLRLVAASGVAPLRLAALEGVVRFGFDDAAPPNVAGQNHFGYVISRRSTAAAPGFVLLSATSAKVEPVKTAQIDLRAHQGARVLTYSDDATHDVSIVIQGNKGRWFDAFETAYAFRVDERRYVFVKWPEDKDGFNLFCRDQASLYAVGAALEEVAALSDNCDV